MSTVRSINCVAGVTVEVGGIDVGVIFVEISVGVLISAGLQANKISAVMAKVIWCFFTVSLLEMNYKVNYYD